MPWICSIYENRPELCKRYPEPGSLLMKSCGYFFPGDGTRQGKCEAACEAACCRMPRLDGIPDNPALPEAAGGLPCKYLVYTEEEIPIGEDSIEEFDTELTSQSDDPEMEA